MGGIHAGNCSEGWAPAAGEWVDGVLLEMMHHSGVPVICTPVSEIYAQRYYTIYIA